MLDAFIIEEIKRRERARQEHQDRPVVELPVPEPEDRPRRSNPDDDEKPSRGVVVIDLRGRH